MIEVVNFVHGPEFLKKSLFRDKKREHSELKLLPEHFYRLDFIMLFPDQMEINITKVNNKEIKVLRIIVLKSFPYNLIVLISSIISSTIFNHLN